MSKDGRSAKFKVPYKALGERVSVETTLDPLVQNFLPSGGDYIAVMAVKPVSESKPGFRSLPTKVSFSPDTGN